MIHNDLPTIDAALAPQSISTDVPLEKGAEGTEASAEDIHHCAISRRAEAAKPADVRRAQGHPIGRCSRHP